ncbi:hypothetical protein DPMN_193807 [Dreissena polymorpha]|uniref:Uncharacterized protein n=1 Tax=Dreissena polymorpha TaxID=45954 RepID=A0A9D3Y2S4_DREPO|nr:hypothetical protein DPMN_193807 [Dreissena polymorpha]
MCTRSSTTKCLGLDGAEETRSVVRQRTTGFPAWLGISSELHHQLNRLYLV